MLFQRIKYIEVQIALHREPLSRIVCYIHIVNQAVLNRVFMVLETRCQQSRPIKLTLRPPTLSPRKTFHRFESQRRRRQ